MCSYYSFSYMFHNKIGGIMQKFFSVIIGSLLFMFLWGCQSPVQAPDEQALQQEQKPIMLLNKGNSFKISEANSVIAQTYTLWAGKNKNVGTVSVSNDETNLYVTYTTTGSNVLTETHLNISSNPFTSRGAPGQYLYNSGTLNNATTYTYTVPLTWIAGTNLYFLAHAVVKDTACSKDNEHDGFLSKKPLKNGKSATGIGVLAVASSANNTGAISGGRNGKGKRGGDGDDRDGRDRNDNDRNNHHGDNDRDGGRNNHNGNNNHGGNDHHGDDHNGKGHDDHDRDNHHGDDNDGRCGECKSETAMAGTIVTPNCGAWYGTFSYIIQSVTPPATYAISGIIYYDVNFNGIQEASELGIAGVQVTLSNGAVATTDINGSYSFTSLTAGSYTVQGPNVEGYDPVTSSTANVTIADSSLTVSFGYVGKVVPL